MSSPDRHGSPGDQAPDYDPAVCISCYKTSILSHKRDRVDLGSMATEDIRWLCWGQGHLETSMTMIRGPWVFGSEATVDDLELTWDKKTG